MGIKASLEYKFLPIALLDQSFSVQPLLPNANDLENMQQLLLNWEPNGIGSMSHGTRTTYYVLYLCSATRSIWRTHRKILVYNCTLLFA